MNTLRIGIIGVGGIARGVHLPGYRNSQHGLVTALCDIDPQTLETAATQLQIPPELCFSDYRQLCNCPDVDAVDICTPNDLHCKITLAAIAAGKPVSIEKPMALSYRDAMDVAEAAQKKDLPGHICFSWRYHAYARYIRWIVDKGAIGRLYHIYIRCVKDSGLWPGRRLEWRFERDRAGTGVLGDLGSHLFDLTRFLTGEEFDALTADTGIHIANRQKLGSEEIGAVTTDDWCNILARMQSGLNATYQISRCAKNIGNWIGIELYGSNGMLQFNDLDGTPKLENCSGEIDSTGKGRHSLVPPARFNSNQSQAYINLVLGRDDGLSATLQDGVICQRTLDAAVQSAKSKQWVQIDTVN